MITSINSSFGKININTFCDGLVLSQERDGTADAIALSQERDGTVDAIALSPEEIVKLAKALFAVKKAAFPDPNKPGITKTAVKIPLSKSSDSHMSKLKAKHAKAYARWTPEEEDKLKLYHSEGKTVKEIAQLLDRNVGSISSRMAKLGLS